LLNEESITNSTKPKHWNKTPEHVSCHSGGGVGATGILYNQTKLYNYNSILAHFNLLAPLTRQYTPMQYRLDFNPT